MMRLQVDYIDLYLVHWPNEAILLQETMSAMEDLVKQGMVRAMIIAMFLAIGVGAIPAQAYYDLRVDEEPLAHPEPVGPYLSPALRKAGRGVSNLIGGWLEIPLNIQQYTRRYDIGGGFFTGLAYGVVKGLNRTFIGVYEVATFFVPIPADFQPILPTLEYYDKVKKRPALLLE